MAKMKTIIPNLLIFRLIINVLKLFNILYESYILYITNMNI